MLGVEAVVGASYLASMSNKETKSTTSARHLSEDELTRVTLKDRLRVAKRRMEHPDIPGKIWLVVATAAATTAATLSAPQLLDGPSAVEVFIAAVVATVCGFLLAMLILGLLGFVRGANVVFRERLLDLLAALRDAEAARDAGVPGEFQLSEKFEEQFAAYRDAVDDFTRLLDEAWRGYRRGLPKAPPMDWHEALPEDPSQRSEQLEDFAKGMAAGCTYFTAQENCTTYNRRRRSVETFFNRVNDYRRLARGFYEKEIVRRVKTQQYSILHLLTYLNGSLARAHFGEEMEPAGWRELWEEEWSTDPPEQRHRGRPQRRIVIADRNPDEQNP